MNRIALFGASAIVAGMAGADVARWTDECVEPLVSRHVKVVAYDLVDQTDGHAELVHAREWLVGHNESQTNITAAVWAVEDQMTGKGTAFVRCAPLSHARVNPAVADFGIEARDLYGNDVRGRWLKVYQTGYPFVRLPYEGGAVGRTKALQNWQRAVRPYISGRDGLFLGNTWGDRNRDTRINETFLLDEVKAAANLGIEVVQVDDGWQSGKSMNSAFADGKGVWNGYWAASPDFWVPDPKRFPHGLSFVTKAAAEKGIRFGLWFGPDSSDDAANWERDADWLLKLHRECGVDYYKLDSMKTTGELSLNRQRRLFDKVMRESDGKVVIDMDVTAEKRPGYFGMMTAGPLFVENRYSDWFTYWPHLTLRALWSLSEVIDPIRLRMEVLNPLRNRDKYGDDPLAPAAYPAETLFAIVMPASPLGWFEIQNLAPETVAAWKPLVAEWKRQRDAMAACNVIPVGARPDGFAWTGFVFTPREKGKPGYGLFFRELAQEARCDFDFRKYLPDAAKVTVLSPRGKADFAGVEAPVRDFVWARFDVAERNSSSIVERSSVIGCREPFMIMRYGWDQTNAEHWPTTLKALDANRACADEVWFSTGTGYPSLDWHRNQSARCAAAAADVRKLGMTASLQIQMTIGHGDPPNGMMNPELYAGKTWQGFTGSNGVRCVTCSCPRDPAFLDYFEKMAAIYATWKPGSVWFDDDLRMTNHKPVSRWITRETDPYGCWCDRCRGDYEKVKDRMGWREFCDRSLAAFAGRVAASVHRVSPETRFGLQSCGDDARLVLAELERVSGHPVSYRSPGACGHDWDDPRLKICDAYRTWGHVCRQGEDAWRRMDRVCTEIETYPSAFSERGPTSIIMQSMTTLAMGMNSMSFYITRVNRSPSYGEDFSYCAKTLYPALARTAGDMKAYAAANAGTVACGFRLEESPTPWPWRLPFYGIPLVADLSRGIGHVITRQDGGLPPDGSVMERDIALARGVTSVVEKVEMPDGRRYVVLQTPFFNNNHVSMPRFREVQELFNWASRENTPVVFQTPARVSLFARTTPEGRLKTVLVQSAQFDETPALTLRFNGISSSACAVRWHETGGRSGRVEIARSPNGSASATIPPIKALGSIWLELSE